MILGAGLAGLFTALKLAPMPAAVLSPAPLGAAASSAWAQGGVAAALAEGDTPRAHAADTVRAGAGIVEAEIARGVAEEAPGRIADLLAIGAPFDRDAAGALVQSREAAHSAPRVVRVKGDTAGAAIMGALVQAVRAAPTIRVIEGLAAERLLLSEGRAVGVLARPADRTDATPTAILGAGVVLATGGIGGLYEVTSNPDGVAGRGLGMAARAGAAIRDPEFVQFHPTGLDVPGRPTPLASEALRGEGATLIDSAGRPLMEGVEGGDLAPRDVVARAIHRELARGGRAFLDTRAALGARVGEAFPTIAAACRAAGIDPVRQPIPVRPLQHSHMGGVATDSSGRTTLPGLWAVGEVACTGLHGANRLASNSLLEGLVFGARAAADIAGQAAAPAGPPDLPAGRERGRAPDAAALAALRAVMTADVGVERDGAGLGRALAGIARIEAGAPASLADMTAAATLIAAAALDRCESRGGHARLDFPERDPALARPTRLTLGDALARRAQAIEAAA